jgi:hypothetical protein
MMCSVKGCDSTIVARGWCRWHYNRWYWHGDPLWTKKLVPYEKQFWTKVNKDGPMSHLRTQCWQWTGGHSNGYGHFRNRNAHRISYELITGNTLGINEIDHRCHNHSCVNPEHLRPATRNQNNQNRQNAQKNSRSGVLGVFPTQSGTWRAVVQHNGKKHALGYFASIHEATKAVQLKRLELFTHNDADHQSG